MGPGERWALAALDRLREGCRIIDAHDRYRYVNQEALRQLRTTRDRVLGRPILEVLPGVGDTRAMAAIHRCREGGEAQSVEASYTFAEGDVVTLDMRIEPFGDEVLILAREITGQRRAEAALARASRALVTLSECNLALVRASDRDGFLRAVCRVAVDRGGYRMAWVGLKGPDPDREVHPVAHAGVDGGYLDQLHVTWADTPRGQGPTGRAIREGEVVSARFIATDPHFTPWREAALARGFASSCALPIRQKDEVAGALMLYAAEPDAFDDAERELLAELALDLGYGLQVLETRAAHVRAEAHVAHLNAVLRGIRNVNRLIGQEKDRSQLLQRSCEVLVEARGFTGAAVVLTGDGAPSLAAAAGFGLKEAALRDLVDGGELPACAREALGAPATVVRHGPRDTCVGCPVAPAHDDEDSLAVRLEHRDRVFGVLLATAARDAAGDDDELTLLREVAGDLAFALGTLELGEALAVEAARTRAMEAQLRQSQRIEAVGRLAGGVAHDFNNLLTVINNYAKIATDALPAGDPIRDDLREVQRAGDRAADLTRQLLAFSRRQVMDVTVLDLNLVLGEVQKMLGRLLGEDIAIVLQLDRDLGKVRADPGQLEQVIVNLAVNARDAMPGGGRLTLRTRNVDLEAGGAPELAPGPYVMLSISDTGEGMDADTQAHVFEPFFTTKEKGKGTGLGLATVHGIVTQSGGTIRAESQPGQGSTFEVYLPRIEADVAEPRPIPAPEAAPGGETILVVEDEPGVRELAVRILSEAGYGVRSAASGAAALEGFEASPGAVDLLLTDVVMPEMSGRELVDRLRARAPGLPVLYMSGYTDDAIVHHGVLDPGTWFMAKPFTAADLTRKVREVLDAAEGRAGPAGPRP